jgi:hypothetical protein
MIEGNKMKRKLIGLLGVALSCLALTTGCSSSNNDSKAANDPHSSAMVENKEYKLAYFEAKANSDIESQYYSLGFYKSGVVVNKDLKSGSDNYQEIIVPDLETPYVKFKDDTYYIYRAPYTMYNQPVIKGKVTKKE